MRRILTVLAVTLALAGIAAPAYAAPSGHSSGHHWAGAQAVSSTSLLVIERRASPLHPVAPGVDPEPTFPEVTVFAHLSGCEPGRLYVVHARFWQHRREINGVAGGLGFEEFACGADGTAEIQQSRYDPQSRLHRGRMRVSFEVRTFEQDVVLASASARVRIPCR